MQIKSQRGRGDSFTGQVFAGGEAESSRSRQDSRDVRSYPCQRFENYRGKTDGRALLIAITNNNFITAYGRAV